MALAVLVPLTSLAVASVSAWLVVPYLLLIAAILFLPEVSGGPRRAHSVREPVAVGTEADAPGDRSSAVDRTSEGLRTVDSAEGATAAQEAEATLLVQQEEAKPSKSKRGRGRGKKAKAAQELMFEPSWVQVAPGKFVRVESPGDAVAGPATSPVEPDQSDPIGASPESPHDLGDRDDAPGHDMPRGEDADEAGTIPDDGSFHMVYGVSEDRTEPETLALGNDPEDQAPVPSEGGWSEGEPGPDGTESIGAISDGAPAFAIDHDQAPGGSAWEASWTPDEESSDSDDQATIEPSFYAGVEDDPTRFGDMTEVADMGDLPAVEASESFFESRSPETAELADDPAETDQAGTMDNPASLDRDDPADSDESEGPPSWDLSDSPEEPSRTPPEIPAPTASIEIESEARAGTESAPVEEESERTGAFPDPEILGMAAPESLSDDKSAPADADAWPTDIDGDPEISDPIEAAPETDPWASGSDDFGILSSEHAEIESDAPGPLLAQGDPREPSSIPDGPEELGASTIEADDFDMSAGTGDGTAEPCSASPQVEEEVGDPTDDRADRVDGAFGGSEEPGPGRVEWAETDGPSGWSACGLTSEATEGLAETAESLDAPAEGCPLADPSRPLEGRYPSAISRLARSWSSRRGRREALSSPRPPAVRSPSRGIGPAWFEGLRFDRNPRRGRRIGRITRTWQSRAPPPGGESESVAGSSLTSPIVRLQILAPTSISSVGPRKRTLLGPVGG